MSFVTPAPNSTQERVDQGKDYGNVRGGIVAVARGVISNVYQNLSGFGYTIVEKLNGGQEIYYGLETGGTPIGVKPGQQVSQGQPVAKGRGTGGIEVGYWNSATGKPVGQGAFPTQAGLNFVSQIQKPRATRTNLSGKVPAYVPAQYRSWVSDAAAGTGLSPQIVAAQINEESGFDPNATSSTGAEGIAQIEPATWKSTGVKGSPYTPSAALQGYISIMSANLRQQNGNVRNALAAYNAGSGNLAAGYGYADTILAKAGAPRTVTAGSPSSYGGTRPGGQPTSSDGSSTGDAVNQIFTDYESEVTLPRTAPASTFSGGGLTGPFNWWWQSFSGQYAQEQNGG